ncbi:MAG: hypothetical protein KGL39_41575 [Patescibacteria group bacterium]|nr:hypothetical protein [Patescibacteria group bacterium]
MTQPSFSAATILVPWASQRQIQSRLDALPVRPLSRRLASSLRNHASSALCAYASMPLARRENAAREFWRAVRRLHLREAARAKLGAAE